MSNPRLQRPLGIESLSPRERQIIALLPDHSQREIADRLGIARETVKTHVKSILTKLNVPNQKAAVLIYTGVRQVVEHNKMFVPQGISLRAFVDRTGKSFSFSF